jgi:hypothetical protein
VINRSFLAREFASMLAEALSSGSLARVLRGAPPQEEHKDVTPYVPRYVEQLLRKRGLHDLTNDILVDYEGQLKRKSPQERSYPVLGTWTHPDAAVLRPFTCAIEIDRSGSLSHFKAALMKAAVHVLSGAYDASLLVYILEAGHSKRDYISDGEPQTVQLLEHLSASGLRLAFARARR